MTLATQTWLSRYHCTVFRIPVSKVSAGFQPSSRSILHGVDGVATVVAGAILDVGDLLLVRLAVSAWAEFVEDGAQGMDDVEVGLFVPAADVVNLAHLARLKDAVDGAAVVFHIEPVADLLAVAVNGQRLAGQGIVDDQRDELFREVVGAVVVGAVGGEYRQAIGVVVGTHQVVAGGLARGVRAVGFVAMGLGERRDRPFPSDP